MTPEGVIGRDGGLPWHLPADLAHFKSVTMGKPIVMGRKTFESIGRPLPGRKNIVVSRRADYSADGVVVVHSLDEALEAAGDVAEIMIIGGAQLYAAALPVAQRIYLTLVGKPVEGNTVFPEVDWARWRMTRRSAQQLSGDIYFYFAVYEKRAGDAGPTG